MASMRDFPIWTRGRAQRHIERGCSIRFVGLIVGSAGKRAADPAMPAEPTEAPMSNILPFRAPAAVRPRAPGALDVGGA
ncbi:hypothetical protein [uncultured Methylobacterium sp.]|uniref:hypothetical protein n=1 Tax=uncultured Methylobacterium sp. TaxID=157278 RepID=UPI0035C9FEFA